MAELLETLTKETFETALETAHSVCARMLGDGAKSAERPRLADRKLPARSERGLYVSAEENLA